MNTSHLKKFAQEARRKLLEQVDAKLNFILTTDSAELREKTEQLKQLRQELGRKTKEQLIEKVAYTWFNRLMALRFMDANDYEPLGIRIITPKDGYTIPEILDEAKRGNIPDELKVDRQTIYDLLDNKLPSTNPQNEAFKELLIASCNHLNKTFPFLFERINDYTELLLPDDLTSDFSIIKDMQNGMLSEDCRKVEIIGWLYQYYISEEKDRLINAKKRYDSHEIAPVTQLFTPKWIVQYMVDNTLGQLWKEARPHSSIINDLEFYIKSENEPNISERRINSPEEISFFDPCVGSAHILCYAFDIFYKIYEEEGYNVAEIPELIITKNLYGVDIDDRASQLAAFALMMKGRQYHRRFLQRGITPNIIAFQNTNLHPKFAHAKTHGSLIKTTQNEVDEVQIENNSLFSAEQKQLIRQASFLLRRYDVIVTNPPYLNSSYMEGELKQFVEQEYNITKSDLFACFLIQATELTKKEGLIGFISPYVWMFISSYKELREHVINNTTITTLIQLEYNAFEPACVPVATFTLKNKTTNGWNGSYIKLSDFKGHINQAPKTLEAIHNRKCGWFHSANQDNFRQIPESPFAYWFKDNLVDSFNQNLIGEVCPPKQGLITGDNLQFVRLWFEVSLNKKDSKWYNFNKGGEFRRWYGNKEHLVDWENEGYRLKNFFDSNGNLRSRPQNTNFYFNEGLSWSKISSSGFATRIYDSTYIFSDAGMTCFPKTEDKVGILALMNSKFVEYIIKALNPTMNRNIGDVNRVPIHPDVVESESIKALGEESISISREDWDASEYSFDFQRNELVSHGNEDNISLEESMELYTQYWQNKFLKLHKNEETLNKQFIEIFEIEKELNPNVLLEDITILQDELDRKLLSKLNNKLIRNPENSTVENYREISLPFVSKEIMAQFISYSVGCMFGRFSLDIEGIVLGNQDDNLHNYMNKIGMSADESKFLPDDDNIIPILDDEWFEDDIVGRFYQFLKITFGEKDFNKNIAFIEEQINKDMRKYFIRDFYPNHIKRYKKRPIYWMFSSPKGSFNVLIYMQRYTPDTVNIILNKYLKEFIGKLNTRKEHLENVQVTGSTSEKTKAIKEIDKIKKTLLELHEYERDILYPLATDRIEIDLDDGVLVNYNKFGKAVKEVSGLNDMKTKEKVRKFDWIDTTQIR